MHGDEPVRVLHEYVVHARRGWLTARCQKFHASEGSAHKSPTSQSTTTSQKFLADARSAAVHAVQACCRPSLTTKVPCMRAASVGWLIAIYQVAPLCLQLPPIISHRSQGSHRHQHISTEWPVKTIIAEPPIKLVRFCLETALDGIDAALVPPRPFLSTRPPTQPPPTHPCWPMPILRSCHHDFVPTPL
jgi:hypothetical protein